MYFATGLFNKPLTKQ